MNKFKKILLGTLSVLTLGLFAVVGTKVNAETHTVSNTTTRTDYVIGDTYTLNVDTVLDLHDSSDFKLDGQSGSTTDKYFGIFYMTGTKWIRKNSNKDLVSNGTGSGSEVCKINVVIGNNQKITVSVDAIRSSSTSTNIYLEDSTNVIVSGSSITSNFSAVNGNASYTYSKSNVNDPDTKTVNIVFEGKLGFDSISATVTNATTYTLTYENNGHGTSQSVVSNITSIPTLPTLVEEGWRFDGWFYDDGTWEQPVIAGESLSANKTIYAKWTDLSDVWNITFKKYSTDTTDYDSVAVAKGESVGSENWPSSPRVLNKNFGGWFDGDTEYTSSTEINGDLSLVAKFNELKNDLVVFGDYTTGLSDVKGEEITDEYTIIDGIVATGSSNKKFGSKSYTIGDVSFNGTTNSNKFIQCGELSFTLTNTSMVTFYGTQTNDSNAKTTHVINTTTNETVMSNFVVSTKVSDSSNVRDSFSVTLPAGTYKTVQSGLLNWYGIRVNQDIKAADTTVTVDADKSTDGDTIRFMGTLAGITDVDNIDSIQLLLSKDGVKAKKDIYFTTVYRSVKGKYAAADNTYYVIFALKDVKDVIGTFNFDVKVSFTDGSYTVNEVQGTYVAE